jgi:hypothetical protein
MYMATWPRYSNGSSASSVFIVFVDLLYISLSTLGLVSKEPNTNKPTIASIY